MSTAPSPPRKREAPAMHIAQQPPQPASPSNRRRYTCGQCERSFTTGGHLARHARVHTGERNHKCPFPGCETRCSRQDNLQQHYRIHLSPGSRRTSGAATRAAMSRQANLVKGEPGARARSRSSSHTPSVGLGTPRSGALGPVDEPPDTPPPLEHAYASVAGSVSGHSSARSTPELVPAPYAALHPSRVSHSPEMAYSAQWEGQQRYAYEREQPPSPASSQDSHYAASAVPVSPHAPYAYNTYSQGPSKYESSPPVRRASLPVAQVPTTSPQLEPHASTSYTTYQQPYMPLHVASYPDTDAHSPQAHYAAEGQQYYAQGYSHARSASPPVTLAPIQNDRLVRGEPLPTLAATYSHPPQPHPQSQPQHHIQHQQSQQHPQSQQSQVGYQYAGYGALAAQGGNWRPEAQAFRRSSLAV